jgi:hypothetical protein
MIALIRAETGGIPEARLIPSDNGTAITKTTVPARRSDTADD